MKQTKGIRWIIGGLAAVAAVIWIQHLGAHKTSEGVGVDHALLESPRMMELYTPYCPSCRAMEPLVTALQAKCGPEGVQVVQVDVSLSANERFLEEYNVKAVPTFIFIDENGKEIQRLVGKQQAATLRKYLAAITGEKCPFLS